MQPATPEQLQQWDQLILANPDRGNVLQTKAFAETKARHGWDARYFVVGDVAITVIARHVPWLGELWYVPRGPGVADLEGIQRFVAAAKQLPNPPFMIKIDPEIPATDITPDSLTATGLKLAPRDLQYNVSTVIVDLRPSEDEILGSFKQKTRYNVRLAAKKGVTVEAVKTDQRAIDQMYALYATTTKRAGVYLRSKQYFTDFWRLHAEAGVGQMFFASYEGTVLAGAFITYLGTKGLYKDGGSVREHPEVQAPYALQWEVMRWLKAQGVEEYDLHGTPPADQIENPNHPLAGLARFKTGFQSSVTEYIGTYDLPLKPAEYQRWNKIGERLAVAYEYRIRKRLYY